MLEGYWWLEWLNVYEKDIKSLGRFKNVGVYKIK